MVISYEKKEDRFLFIKFKYTNRIFPVNKRGHS